jgi:hypothetical protein
LGIYKNTPFTKKGYFYPKNNEVVQAVIGEEIRLNDMIIRKRMKFIVMMLVVTSLSSTPRGKKSQFISL